MTVCHPESCPAAVPCALDKVLGARRADAGQDSVPLTFPGPIHLCVALDWALGKERETVDSRAAPGRQANFWPQIIGEPEVRPVGQESIRLLVFVQAEA